MNSHDDARPDRSDGDPPTDDEVTTDVDPAWIAAIQADLDSEAPHAPDATDARSDAADGGSDDAAWLDAEPAWDPEATVGVSDGLIERIRSEIATTSPTPTPAHGRSAAPPPLPPETSIDPPLARPAPPAPPVPGSSPVVDVVGAAPQPIAPPPIDPVPISKRALATDVDRETSTTVRWEPRQRLTTAAPVNESVAIAPTPTSSLDRTKVAIAIVAAVAIVVIVWLFVGSGDGDAPPPTDSVPSSVDGSTPTASIVADPALDGAGG